MRRHLPAVVMTAVLLSLSAGVYAAETPPVDRMKIVLMTPEGKKTVLSGTKEDIWKYAEGFIDKGDYDYARDSYLQMVEKDPGDIRSNILLGQLYQFKYSKNAEAVKYYKRAERLVPASNSKGKAFCQRLTAEVYRELAEKTNSLIYFVQAISEYEKILDVDPDNIEVMYYLASCRLNGKDYPAAIQLFKRIIEQDPKGEWVAVSKKAISVAEQEQKARRS